MGVAVPGPREVADRRAVSSLWDARKEWAHGGRFSDDQTERVLGDAESLLRSVGGVLQADQVSGMRRICAESGTRRISVDSWRRCSRASPWRRTPAGLPAWRMWWSRT